MTLISSILEILYMYATYMYVYLPAHDLQVNMTFDCFLYWMKNSQEYFFTPDFFIYLYVYVKLYDVQLFDIYMYTECNTSPLFSADFLTVNVR